MKYLLAIATFLLSLIPALTYAGCMNQESLLALEDRWSDAFARQSVTDVRRLLHPKFVWVHDHAGMIHNSPDELLSFLSGVWRESLAENPPSADRDVKTIIHAGTGIVYGYTDAQRNGQIITYHFMRTYVIEDDSCVILAIHTMEVPEA